MNSFAVLLLCVQACLVQTVFSQCLGKYGPAIAPAAALGPFGYPAGIGALGYPAGLAGPCDFDAYGGAGEGNVAVAGELPVVGTTAIAGQVPVMGAVSFSGPVPAAGIVSISGNCACACGAPYGSPYLY